MASPGRRPKPAHLRIVDGTHRADRHGDQVSVQEAVAQSQAAFGSLAKPKALKGNAGKAWDQYIAPAFWLDGSQEPAALIFCELWAEWKKSPTLFPSTKHTHLRRYMHDLGLMYVDRGKPSDAAAPKDEFFDD